jgi:hypothetical protein
MPFHHAAKTLIALLSGILAVTSLAGDARIRVIVSKETTMITEPLRQGGLPDYIAALNERYGEAATSENNAVVPFWRAMGPRRVIENRRERYFKMLGIAPLPEDTNYFVTSANQITLNEDSEATAAEKDPRAALRQQLKTALDHPWSKARFPIWAEWLETNKRPLALLIEASKRPRQYDPLVGSYTDTIGDIGPPTASHNLTDDIVEVFRARAMLRLGSGRTADAWHDVLTLFRLSRVLGRGATMWEHAAADRINEGASCGLCALLRHAKPTVAEIAVMRADYSHVPPVPKIVETIDAVERFSHLDSILYHTRFKRPSEESIARWDRALEKQGRSPEYRAASKLAMESMGDATLDWNLVLRLANVRYDRYVKACHKPAGVGRSAAMKAVDEQIATEMKAAEARQASESSEELSREARARRIESALYVKFSNSVQTHLEVEDRTMMRCELMKLALALAAYHADHGSYPEKLPDQMPKYTTDLPKDIFQNGAELHYTRQGDGYLLYSVGPNGKDDGGRGREDHQNKGGWDDLAVRMSAEAY